MDQRHTTRDANGRLPHQDGYVEDGTFTTDRTNEAAAVPTEADTGVTTYRHVPDMCGAESMEATTINGVTNDDDYYPGGASVAGHNHCTSNSVGFEGGHSTGPL